MTGPPAAAGGRMIAGTLRPFTTRASHHAPAKGADKMVNGTAGPLPPGSHLPQAGFHRPIVSISQPARPGQVRVAGPGLRG